MTGIYKDLMGRLLAKRREGAAQATPVDGDDKSVHLRFETLPGYSDAEMLHELGQTYEVANPYFLEHDGDGGATTVIAGRRLDNFSSYDYLGLNRHPEVRAAAHAAIDSHGTSATASRLVAGERPVHRRLEAALAANYGAEDAVVFVSGHATNIAIIGTLLGPRDLVVYDALAHNSIVLGAVQSGAERRSFPHGDLDSLDLFLTQNRDRYNRALIAVEGHYSMDGDLPDLARLVELKKRHSCWLMVDEAHSLGVLGDGGRGIFEHAGVDPSEVDIWMGTLSKTLATCGGYVAGCRAMIDYLRYKAGGFVYSVGLSPPLAAAAATALAVMGREPERVARLRRNGAIFLEAARAAGLDVGASVGRAIVPVIVGNSLSSIVLANRLLDLGINVQPIIHPAVPELSARLRFFLSSEHDPDVLRRVPAIVARELKKVGNVHALAARFGKKMLMDKLTGRGRAGPDAEG